MSVFGGKVFQDLQSELVFVWEVVHILLGDSWWPARFLGQGVAALFELLVDWVFGGARVGFHSGRQIGGVLNFIRVLKGVPLLMGLEAGSGLFFGGH